MFPPSRQSIADYSGVMSLYCTLSKDTFHGEVAKEMGFACGNALQILPTSACSKISFQQPPTTTNTLPPNNDLLHCLCDSRHSTYLSPNTTNMHPIVFFRLLKCLCFVFLCGSKTYFD